MKLKMVTREAGPDVSNLQVVAKSTQASNVKWGPHSRSRVFAFYPIPIKLKPLAVRSVGVLARPPVCAIRVAGSMKLHCSVGRSILRQYLRQVGGPNWVPTSSRSA